MSPSPLLLSRRSASKSKGGLAWAPPILGEGGVAVVNHTLTNASRSITGGAGRDLRITQTQVITAGAIDINGWRNVVWIGGEVNLTTGSEIQTAVIPRNISGIFHMEGVWIHGNKVGDAFVVRQDNNNFVSVITCQIQNCRLEADFDPANPGFHADCWQHQGAMIQAVRFDKCSLRTNYQGLFMHVDWEDLSSSYIRNVDVRRVDFGPGNGGGLNYFWQTWEQGDNTTTQYKIVPITLSDVWMTGGQRVGEPGRWVVPASTFEDPHNGGSMKRGAFVGSDGVGQYVYFSDGSQIVPTGSFAGQQSLDCEIDGIIRVGTPPGGDFCPVTVPGLSYISPGYESSQAPPMPPAISGLGYSLTFSDEFDTLDYGNANKWNPIWYSNQPSDSVFLVEPSVVRIIHKTSHSHAEINRDICTSHKSDTNGVYFRYGYFEARIKASATWGTWPGVWLFSKNHRQGTSSGSSLVSELDIMEGYTRYKNAQGTVVEDSNDSHSTLHRNTSSLFGVPDEVKVYFRQNGPDWVNGFVTFGCLWTPTEIKYYVDDVLIATQTPYDSTDQDMFFVLSAYWDANSISGYPTFPATDIWVDCDWVRVWQGSSHRMVYS